MVAVPLQVAAVLVQAVPEVVVLVVGAAVDLGVQGDHCSPSSPSARLGAVADVRAEELALVAVLAPAAQAQALVVPDPVALAQVALAQVVPDPVAPDPVAPAPAVLAQVLADAPVPGVALSQAMVRTAHTAIHRPVRQSRQVIQIRPQSRHRAIWITTKSQTVMTVHSAVAVNQLG